MSNLIDKEEQARRIIEVDEYTKAKHDNIMALYAIRAKHGYGYGGGVVFYSMIVYIAVKSMHRSLQADLNSMHAQQPVDSKVVHDTCTFRMNSSKCTLGKNDDKNRGLPLIWFTLKNHPILDKIPGIPTEEQCTVVAKKIAERCNLTGDDMNCYTKVDGAACKISPYLGTAVDTASSGEDSPEMACTKVSAMMDNTAVSNAPGCSRSRVFFNSVPIVPNQPPSSNITSIVLIMLAPAVMISLMERVALLSATTPYNAVKVARETLQLSWVWQTAAALALTTISGMFYTRATDHSNDPADRLNTIYTVCYITVLANLIIAVVTRFDLPDLDDYLDLDD